MSMVVALLAGWSHAGEPPASGKIPALIGYVQFYRLTYDIIETCYDQQVARTYREAVRQAINSCPLSVADKDYFRENADSIDHDFHELWSRIGHPPEHPEVRRGAPARCNELSDEYRSNLMRDGKRLDRFIRGEISAVEAIGGTCSDLIGITNNK
jgi:hypothetical protein